MGKQKKRTWQMPELTTGAKIGITLGVFVLIAVAAIFITTTTISRQLAGSGDLEKKNFASKDTTDRQSDALADADSALKGGNDKKASDIYGQAIDAETDPTRKVILAIDQSRLLYGADKYDEAIDVAKKAESYSDDKYLISDWLGRLYEGGKRYTDAALYYTQAGASADSPTNDKGYDKKYYDSKVAKMKSLAEKG